MTRIRCSVLPDDTGILVQVYPVEGTDKIAAAVATIRDAEWEQGKHYVITQLTHRLNNAFSAIASNVLLEAKVKQP